MAQRKRLGDYLIEAGIIDQFQLQSALGHQRQWGGKLGRILVENRFVKEDVMVRALSELLRIDAVELSLMTIHARVIELVPVDMAERFGLIPVALKREKAGEFVYIAMSDPTNLEAVDAIQFKTGKKVRSMIAGDSAIDRAIRHYYYGETPRETASTPAGQVQFSGREIALSPTHTPPTQAAVQAPAAAGHPALVVPPPATSQGAMPTPPVHPFAGQPQPALALPDDDDDIPLITGTPAGPATADDWFLPGAPAPAQALATAVSAPPVPATPAVPPALPVGPAPQQQAPVILDARELTAVNPPEAPLPNAASVLSPSQVPPPTPVSASSSLFGPAGGLLGGEDAGPGLSAPRQDVAFGTLELPTPGAGTAATRPPAARTPPVQPATAGPAPAGLGHVEPPDAAGTPAVLDSNLLQPIKEPAVANAVLGEMEFAAPESPPSASTAPGLEPGVIPDRFPASAPLPEHLLAASGMASFDLGPGDDDPLELDLPGTPVATPGPATSTLTVAPNYEVDLGPESAAIPLDEATSPAPHSRSPVSDDGSAAAMPGAVLAASGLADFELDEDGSSIELDFDTPTPDDAQSATPADPLASMLPVQHASDEPLESRTEPESPGVDDSLSFVPLAPPQRVSAAAAQAATITPSIPVQENSSAAETEAAVTADPVDVPPPSGRDPSGLELVPPVSTAFSFEDLDRPPADAVPLGTGPDLEVVQAEEIKRLDAPSHSPQLETIPAQADDSPDASLREKTETPAAVEDPPLPDLPMEVFSDVVDVDAPPVLVTPARLADPAVETPAPPLPERTTAPEVEGAQAPRRPLPPDPVAEASLVALEDGASDDLSDLDFSLDIEDPPPPLAARVPKELQATEEPAVHEGAASSEQAPPLELSPTTPALMTGGSPDIEPGQGVSDDLLIPEVPAQDLAEDTEDSTVTDGDEHATMHDPASDTQAPQEQSPMSGLERTIEDAAPQDTEPASPGVSAPPSALTPVDTQTMDLAQGAFDPSNWSLDAFPESLPAASVAAPAPIEDKFAEPAGAMPGPEDQDFESIVDFSESDFPSEAQSQDAVLGEEDEDVDSIIDFKESDSPREVQGPETAPGPEADEFVSILDFSESDSPREAQSPEPSAPVADAPASDGPMPATIGRVEGEPNAASVSDDEEASDLDLGEDLPNSEPISLLPPPPNFSSASALLSALDQGEDLPDLEQPDAWIDAPAAPIARDPSEASLARFHDDADPSDALDLPFDAEQAPSPAPSATTVLDEPPSSSHPIEDLSSALDVAFPDLTLDPPTEDSVPPSLPAAGSRLPEVALDALGDDIDAVATEFQLDPPASEPAMTLSGSDVAVLPELQLEGPELADESLTASASGPATEKTTTHPVLAPDVEALLDNIDAAKMPAVLKLLLEKGLLSLEDIEATLGKKKD
ncbi:MAG: hypothetical protein ABIJ09_15820 [Pseudomonadota bacterium]